MFKKLVFLLIAEIILIGLVGFIFASIHERLTAGLVAGSLFILLGLWIFVWGVRDASFRRTWTFYAGCVHLFIVALPMVITRFMNAALAFENVKILGLPGPLFHQLSSGVYAALIAATVIDLLRMKMRGRVGAARKQK